ncbi:MAG: glycosyl hydrolase [Bacteroidota bacterium]|nr:glycosyl hydrolase [Bacteroidota bacterium]
MIKTSFALIVLLLTGLSGINQTPDHPSAKFNIDGKTVTVYTTADKTDKRITATGTLQFSNFGQPFETQVCVFVDPNHTFQTMLGIGGALTDAAAETFAKLPKSKQQEFLKAYYNARDGIGYTVARTNINSCDFSSDMYTYVQDNDKDLKSFDVKHDRQYKIPLIKQAMQAAGGKLNLFGSPWSPPAWMKDNNNMLQGGKLLPQYRQSWADYYVKFIKAYEKEGIPVWGVSVQNEPMAKQRWESCIFTAEEERDFIKQYLGPTLQKSGLASKKLIAWDHNRDLIYQRASTILDDAAAAKYVWGIGYHWYETWTGSAMQFDNLRRVKETFPAKNLFFTEGCIEKFNFDKLNGWELGEKYGRSMINDFNAGTVGWTDWNVLLDETGGPNHVGNFCYAPIIADTRDGSLHYTDIYYYIGHFSKFIRPGAKRVVSSSNRDKLLTTSYINPDGKLVVVVMNASDDNIVYNLWIAGKAAQATSLPHSIATLIIS